MLKRLSIITLLISMGCPFAFSEASRPNRDLGRAYEMLEKYFKSMDGGYRRLFQDYLSDAAASGDEVAEYDYYHFYRYKKYKDTELADIRLNDSLAIVYLKDAVAKDYLPPVENTAFCSQINMNPLNNMVFSIIRTWHSTI